MVKKRWWKVGLSVFSHFAFRLFCEAKTASEAAEAEATGMNHISKKAFNTKNLHFRQDDDDGGLS